MKIKFQHVIWMEQMSIKKRKREISKEDLKDNDNVYVSVDQN